jgi:hypothetical protein
MVATFDKALLLTACRYAAHCSRVWSFGVV